MKNMIVSVLLQVLLVTAISGSVAFIVSKKMAPGQNESQRVLVVRTTDVQKGMANLKDPAQQKVIAERVAKLNAKITEAVQNGAIVIDADSVLRAPDGAFIVLDQDAAEPDKNKEKEAEK